GADAHVDDVGIGDREVSDADGRDRFGLAHRQRELFDLFLGLFGRVSAPTRGSPALSEHRARCEKNNCEKRPSRQAPRLGPLHGSHWLFLERISTGCCAAWTWMTGPC